MQACKPGSVSAVEAVSIIYLALSLLTGSNGLPFPKVPEHIGTGRSRFGIYLAFQLLGFTAIPVTRKSRELLPHVFTFSPNTRGSLFSVALSVPGPFQDQALPVRKQDALYCPDFPLSQLKSGQR